MTLHADNFFADPRLAAAKKLLKEALVEHQTALEKPQPPHGNRKVEFEELIEELSQIRGGKLFYPFIGSGFGKGALVELLDGSIKYDFITGIGVHGFGHSNPDLLEELLDAGLSDTVMQGHLQQNRDTLELCKLFRDLSGLPHCFLSSTGVMANENALKIAFQNKAPAKRIFAFDKCFMGRTIAIASVTDKPVYRAGLPETLNVDYLPFYDEKDPVGSREKALNAARTALTRYPGKHAVAAMELIQGEAGFKVGCREFFRPLMQLLRDHGVLILADEVQSFGRTRAPFAFQYFGLEDLVDMVTVGKLSQACATLFRGELIPRPGLLAQTFTTSTSAIRASRWILKQFLQGDICKRNTEVGARFAENLESLAHKYPGKVSGPYGIGAMVAFTPEEGTTEQALSAAKKLFDAGVLCFTAGSNPTRIRFLLPAFVLKDEEIEHACALIESTLCT